VLAVVRCSEWQYVTVSFSVLQRVAVCYSVFQCVAAVTVSFSVLQLLQCLAVCCSCYSVFQCVAAVKRNPKHMKINVIKSQLYSDYVQHTIANLAAN